MDDTNVRAESVSAGTALLARIETRIAELEREMGHLQLRHPGTLAIANAWAERHDAIVAMTPRELRPDVESRLRRIGIRWGVMAGARVTQEFRALGGHAGLRGRLPDADGTDGTD